MTKISLGTLLGFGVIIGFLLITQLNTPFPVEGGSPAYEVSAKEDLIKSFLDEQDYLQNRIINLREEIAENQQNIEVFSETANLEILESLKNQIGLTEINGEGLEIILDDSPLIKRTNLVEPNDSNLIQASDLRDTVNVLNAARADGISINNQRIISSSSIISVGTTILVNNSHIAPPFTIKAVGDWEIMLQRLQNRNLLPELYSKKEKSELLFEIFKKNNIKIPMYNGTLRVDYLNLI